MFESPQLLRRWRGLLVAAGAVVAISAAVALRDDDVGSGGPADAVPVTSTSTTTSTSPPPAGDGGTAAPSTPSTSPEPTSGSTVTDDTASTSTPGRDVSVAERPGRAVPVPTPTSVPTSVASVPSSVAPTTVVGPSTTVRVAVPTTRPPATAPSPPPGTSGSTVVTTPPAAVVGSGVDALTVAAEWTRTGYQRSLFPHWSDLDGNGCTTREDMLFATVIGFPQVDLFDRCVIVEGDWYSIYDGVLHAGQPGDVDVDHVVALAEAWDSGAWAWDEATRRRFANDRDNLLVVTASSNRSKSDRDVGEWRPERREAWCMTATMTVTIKSRYQLSVDATELRALRDMLATCTSANVGAVGTSPPPVSTPTPTTTPTTTTTTTTPPTHVSSCIDVNTASETDLQAIIHIGPTRAAEIVRLRPFSSVDDLTRVNGIGPSRLQDIVDQGLVCP